MTISNQLNSSLLNGSWSQFPRWMESSVAPLSGIILATSVVALAGLGIYRWNQNTGSKNQDPDFAKVKERICRAYAYVFGGFVLTGAAAALSHISGISTKLLLNQYYYIPVTISLIGSTIAVNCIDKENTKMKHLFWALFNVSMGVCMSPLGFLGKSLIGQAAAISLGLGGLLTSIAFIAPDKEFMKWHGPLMAVLSSITIASSVACFFPKTAFAYGMDRLSLYGGLAIFSFFLMSNTHRLIKEAEKSDDQFDPINASHAIYSDMMSLFVRIVKFLSENKKTKKQGQEA